MCSLNGRTALVSTNLYLLMSCMFYLWRVNKTSGSSISKLVQLCNITKQVVTYTPKWDSEDNDKYDGRVGLL